MSGYIAEIGVKVETIKKGLTDTSSAASQSQVDDNTVWYHEGTADLMSARYWIADYSMPRLVATRDVLYLVSIDP